jgi:hypothetical protein
VLQSCSQQSFVERVAADHAVECDHARCRDTLGHVEKVTVHEIDVSGTIVPGRLVGGRGEVRRGRLDNGGSRDSTRQELEGQGTETCADVQEHTIDQPSSGQAIPEQPRCRTNALTTVAPQFFRDLLCGELLFGCVTEIATRAWHRVLALRE